MMEWLPRWIVAEVVDEVDAHFRREAIDIIHRIAQKPKTASGERTTNPLSPFEYAALARAVWQHSKTDEGAKINTKVLVKKAVKHWFDFGAVLWHDNATTKRTPSPPMLKIVKNDKD